MSTILKVEDLSYWVEKPKHAILKDVNLKFEIGESLTIIGPNGAGKTTLLKSIAGLLSRKHTKGDVFLKGKNISELQQKEIGKIVSYVPQRPILPSQMRLFDYVLLGRTSHIPIFLSERSKDLDIAKDALQKTGMEWAANRMLHTLSGGETQLAAIARSLASKASLLLFDEPTASLDLGHCYKLCQLIYDLPKDPENNVAVISTMHDLQLAGRFGDELLLLDDGEICIRGKASEVLTPENIERYYGISADVNLLNSREVIILPLSNQIN